MSAVRVAQSHELAACITAWMRLRSADSGTDRQSLVMGDGRPRLGDSRGRVRIRCVRGSHADRGDAAPALRVHGAGVRRKAMSSVAVGHQSLDAGIKVIVDHGHKLILAGPGQGGVVFE